MGASSSSGKSSGVGSGGGAEDHMDMDVLHDDLFLEQAYREPADLSEVLRRPHVRNQFREFLRRSFASENLLFFETIELYQKIDKPQWRQIAGAQMVEKFLDPDSMYQVNLSSSVMDGILRAKFFLPGTFDAAKSEIYQLMSDNFFNRFVAALKVSQQQMAEIMESQRSSVQSQTRTISARFRRVSSAQMKRISSRLRRDSSHRSLVEDVEDVN